MQMRSSQLEPCTASADASLLLLHQRLHLLEVPQLLLDIPQLLLYLAT